MTRQAITLSRALSDWAGYLRLRRRARSTQVEYRHTGDLLEHRFGGDCDPASITLNDLEGLVGAWEHLSANTVRLRVSAITSFFAYCEERYSPAWDVAWRNPTRLLARPAREDPVLRRLTAHEVARLLAADLPVRLRIIVHTLAYTGVRRSEFLGLTWGDVDLIDARLLIGLSKTRKGRVVPLPAALVDVLARAKNERPASFTDDACYLLPRQAGHQYGHEAEEYPDEPAGQHSYDRAIKRAARIAGIRKPDDVTGHMFRRFLAETLLDAGKSPYVVAALLGHASIQTTAGYGGGASLASVRSAIQSLALADTQDRAPASPHSSTSPLQPALDEPRGDPRDASNPAGGEGSTPNG